MSSKNARKDPAWKYCVEIDVPPSGVKKGYKYMKCNFCSKDFKGGVKRMKDHLAGTHKDAAPCLTVPAEVKDEIKQYLKAFQDSKFAAQRNFEENVESGAYYTGSSASVSNRGVRGPMDRHVVSEGGSKPAETMPSVSSKEHRNQVCLDIGRFFYENGIPFHAATSPSFTSMLHSVGNFGRGLKPPNVWKNCAWATKDDGKNVKKIIMDERYFWPSVVYTLQTTNPLVEVLRIVDGEQTPAMGFLYGAMDTCKEKIAKNLNNVQASYKEIWDIIDEKWDFQMHRSLHAAAYYLNPKFRWSFDVSNHPEIKRGLYDVMERLVKDNEVYMKIEEQLILYREKKGLFGYRGSLATYQTRPPVLWWGEYGDDTPELKAFAMKILGLTCSASACERNWSTFNQVYTKRRNRLTTERMDDLVFIMYNRKLKQKFVKRSNLKEDEDPLLVENVMSDDEWIANPSDDDEKDVIEVDAANVEESDEVIRTTRGNGATKTRRGGGIIERGGGTSSSKKRKAALHLIDEDDDDEDWIAEDCEDDEDDVPYAI